MNGPVIFDTNILIDLFSGRVEAKNTLDLYQPQHAISLITWMEVMVGAKRFHQEQRTRMALNAFQVIEISTDIAEQSVNLRQKYGMKLPDAIILATANIHRRALVTRNAKDFADLPGVIVPYAL
ncbi:type II toxin-antitoxin system VapC family toxin [Salmonella enterica subsp. enterica]|nr:type II toxin-antitoxin system VapC family toxin [Salmonella enterica subsp. enterica]